MKITICGSMKFVDHMAEARDFLQKRGHDVFVPDPLVTEEWFREKYSKEELFKNKPIWTKKQWDKIKGSDAVLILNKEKKGIEGYFGSNTLMELAVAFYLGKKIYFLCPIGEDHPHYEEVIAIDSIVLNNDLTKII